MNELNIYDSLIDPTEEKWNEKILYKLKILKIFNLKSNLSSFN